MDRSPIRLILYANGTWAFKRIAQVPDYMMTVANRDFQGLFRVVTSKHFIAPLNQFTLTYAYIVWDDSIPSSSPSSSPSPSSTPTSSISLSSTRSRFPSSSTLVMRQPTRDINTTVAALLTPEDIALFGLPIGAAVISCTARDLNTQKPNPQDMTHALVRVFQMCVIAQCKVVLKHIKGITTDVRPSGICIFPAVGEETTHFYYNTDQLMDKLNHLNSYLILTTDAESYSFTYGKDVYTVYYRTNKLLAVKDKDWYSRTRHGVEQWLPDAEHIDYAIKGCWGMSKKNLKTGAPVRLTDWDLWKLRNIRPMVIFVHARQTK